MQATWRSSGCCWTAQPTRTRQEPNTALVDAAMEGHLELIRLLLDHSADPNQASSTRRQHRIDTCCLRRPPRRRSAVALLFSADPSAQIITGENPQAIAIRARHPVVADCLGTLAGWPAFKVAAACRLHADARRMLHLGTVDPSTAAWPSSPLSAAPRPARGGWDRRGRVMRLRRWQERSWRAGRPAGTRCVTAG